MVCRSPQALAHFREIEVVDPADNRLRHDPKVAQQTRLGHLTKPPEAEAPSGLLDRGSNSSFEHFPQQLELTKPDQRVPYSAKE